MCVRDQLRDVKASLHLRIWTANPNQHTRMGHHRGEYLWWQKAIVHDTLRQRTFGVRVGFLYLGSTNDEGYSIGFGRFIIEVWSPSTLWTVEVMQILPHHIHLLFSLLRRNKWLAKTIGLNTVTQVLIGRVIGVFQRIRFRVEGPSRTEGMIRVRPKVERKHHPHWYPLGVLSRMVNAGYRIDAGIDPF